MRRVVSALTASLLIVLSVFSFLPTFPIGVHAATNTIQWQDDFENYACGTFPDATWLLRFNGAGNASQYVDCTTAFHGTKSLHLLGVDVTGSCTIVLLCHTRWSASADRAFSLDGASVIQYDVFVKTGPLHSPGTGEVACNVGFDAPGASVWGVYPALVQFTDNGMILPGNVPYSNGTWYEVRATVDMFTNTFDLQINGNDAGTFQADISGQGNFLPEISRLALVSNHAGRECWFDQATVETTTLLDDGDFSYGFGSWSSVSVKTSQNAQGVVYPTFEVLTGPPGAGASSSCFPSARLGNPFLSINVPFGADGYVEQQVTVPAHGKPHLSFLSWGWEGNNSMLGFSGLVDAYARILDANGTEHSLEPSGFWTPQPMFTPTTSSTAVCTGKTPMMMSYDLSAYSGQSVKLRLGATSQNCCGTYAFFDDVQVSSGAFLIPTTVSLSADPSTVVEGTSTKIMSTVLDQIGGVMQGVSVSFATTAGQLSSQSGITDSNGEATVSLSLNQQGTIPTLATVTGTVSNSIIAGTVSNSIAVTFIPPNYAPQVWSQDKSFHVLETDVNLAQYLSIPVAAYNGCVWIHWCSGSQVDLSKVPSIRIYLLTPSALSSTALSDFDLALSYYFGLRPCTQSSSSNCIQSDYAPLATLIFEVPVVQAAKEFFKVSLAPPVSFRLPDYVTWLTESNNITTTPTGYVDVAFTFSVNTNNTTTVLQDALQAVAQDVTLLYKSDLDADTILANLKVVLDIGDVTVSVIKNDLDNVGSLKSYTLLDMSTLIHVVSKLIDVKGIANKIIDMLVAAGKAGSSAGTDLLDDVRVVVTGLDIEVELLPYLVGSLENNDLFNWFETGLNIVTTLIDPPNATIIPSVYDAQGNLVLGYNPKNGIIIFASPNGILLPNGNGYLALVTENSTSPSSYSEVLNGLGTNASVPYDVRVMSYNQTASVGHYVGMLPGGSNVTVPAELNPSDGSLIPGLHLKPTLSANVNGRSLAVVAKATLSNGALSVAASGTLVVGTTPYTMIEDNSSTFEAIVGLDPSTPTIFSVYLFSPIAPGGFASGLTPIPPATAASVSPNPNSSGWNNANVTVALSASNGRDSKGQSSGVKEINYALIGAQTGSTTIPVNASSITIYAEGNTTISYYATDNSGNTEALHSLTFLVDKTPPNITSVQDEQAVILRQSVVANARCTDVLSGVATCVIPTGFIDTSTVGPHNYTVTSTDRAGNTRVYQVRYQVHYNYILIFPQSAGTGTQVGRTIPVRFQLTDALGSFVSNVAARVWVDSLTNPGKSSGSSNTGNYFRYDATYNQYIFNLSTNGMTTGSHSIYITLDDGTVHTMKVRLTR